MANYFPEVRDVYDAVRQANIAQRARSLWADGYTWRWVGTGCIEVYKPGASLLDVHLQPDDWYSVQCEPEMHPRRCSCAAFGKWGDCKHRIALDWTLTDDPFAEGTASDPPYGIAPEWPAWILQDAAVLGIAPVDYALLCEQCSE